MDLISKTDAEIREIAEPLWNDLIRHSNNRITAVSPKTFQNLC